MKLEANGLESPPGLRPEGSDLNSYRMEMFCAILELGM